MLKCLIVLISLTTLNNFAKCQSIHVEDLIQLAKLSHQDASRYMVLKKGFEAIPLIKIHGQTISQFSKVEGDVSELIVKSQFPNTNGGWFASIHLELKPKTYVAILIKELEQAKFKLTEKNQDSYKDFKLYDNGLYTVSVYIFKAEKLPASIELHIK